MKKLMIIALALAGGISCLHAQNSIKLLQQPSTFYYLQFNSHLGITGSPEGTRFGTPGRGAANQITFQAMGRSQTRLQRGYTPLITLTGWKVRTSLVYSEAFDGTDKQASFVDLRLRDAWWKFGTKWDRTSLTVGYKALPYGHNPKIDPASSFMTDIISTDLGLSRDLGVYLKTPLTRELDLELGLTSGGVLNNPLFRTESTFSTETIIINEGGGPRPGPGIPTEVTTSETSASVLPGFAYNGTWLITGRVGNPSFRKNEFGIFGAMGKLPSNYIADENATVAHIGGDWVYKHKERFRVTNQVVTGFTGSETEGGFFNFSLQNSMDVFFKQKLIYSVAHSANVNAGSESSYTTSTLSQSLGYAINPHTRIRLNQYVTGRNYADNNWGVSLQFVTGLGKR